MMEFVVDNIVFLGVALGFLGTYYAGCWDLLKFWRD